MSPLIDYPVPVVSLEVICIQATINVLSRLYLYVYEFIYVMIIIKEKEAMNLRQRERGTQKMLEGRKGAGYMV